MKKKGTFSKVFWNLAVLRWPTFWLIPSGIFLVILFAKHVQCFGIRWYACIFPSLKYMPPFLHNPFLAWLVRFAISDPTHFGDLTSNPFELAYKSFFRVFIILHGLAFMVLVTTHLLTGNSMFCWLIWGDHSLLRCLTTKKISVPLIVLKDSNNLL